MASVYILRGSSGRYYIGSTENLARRLTEHQRGSNHTTRRLSAKLELVISKTVSGVKEERKIELALKRKKNPRLAIPGPGEFALEQPLKPSGLVVGLSPTQPTLSEKTAPRNIT